MTEEASSKLAEETVLRTWQARIHVLNNSSAWSGVSLCFGVGAFFLGLLLLFITKSVTGLLVAFGIFCGLMVLFVLVGGAIDLFGGFRVTFILTDRGVWSITGSGARAAADAAVVGGIFAGSLTGIATGFAARSEQNVFIPYGEISRLKVKDRRRSVLVRGKLLEKPIELYCTVENFHEVQKILMAQSPAAFGAAIG